MKHAPVINDESITALRKRDSDRRHAFQRVLEASDSQSTRFACRPNERLIPPDQMLIVTSRFVEAKQRR
jgi:hypothetical protein